MSERDDTANHFDASFQGDSGEQSHPEGSQPTGGASPSTKKRGNYKIPLILGAIGLLLMISPFFYSAYVDATVGRGGPDDVSAGWAFVGGFYRFTPAGLVVLVIALFPAFPETLSSLPRGHHQETGPG